MEKNEKDLDAINKTKKELKKYKNNKKLISRLNSKLYYLTERIENISAVKYSDMPKGGDRITIEDLIADKEELENRINRLKKKGRELKIKILNEIDTLEDVRHAEILEAYFIDCLDFSEIAYCTGYAERHVVRLYHDAIKLLSLKCQ